MKFLLFIFLIFSTGYSDDLSIFSGRISRMNSKASLIRIKTNFSNLKYLNKNDYVNFWTDTNPNKKCVSKLIGKSHDYMLLKIPDYKVCLNFIGLTTGSYLKFQSDDLKENIQVGRKLIEILIKKRLALHSKVKRNEKDIGSYLAKVEAINGRFETLKEKLLLEWQNELSAVEEDKAYSLKRYKNAQARLDEVEFKLEKYRVNDENLKLDRWSLDSELYKKK